MDATEKTLSDLREKKVQRLTAKLNSLTEQLDKSITAGTNLDALVEQIHQAENELYILRITRKVKEINKEQKEHREFARRFLEVLNTYSDKELCSLVTNEGKLHKIKVKKYPLLASLLDDFGYLYFNCDYNNGIKANYNRKRYARAYTYNDNRIKRIFELVKHPTQAGNS